MSDLLASFSCPLNTDVEQFLTSPNKAIRFEQSDKARTSLILDSVTGEILAYFAISTKQIDIQGTTLSGNAIKRIDGINKRARTASAFLIGQLGKNSTVAANPLSLEQILAEAYSVIDQARKLVGGRMVVLECEDNAKLIKLYEQHNFKRLPVEQDEPDGLITLYDVITT